MDSMEGFNKFILKFLPNDITYCKTIDNQGRVYLAVGLQSIGYRQVYKRVFALVWMTSPVSSYRQRIPTNCGKNFIGRKKV
jgi:hypothetical protein